MSILEVILLWLIVGVIVAVIVKYVPMAEPFRSGMIVVVFILLLLYTAAATGVLGPLNRPITMRP